MRPRAERSMSAHRVGPTTAYGKTKLAAEEEARRAVGRGVDVVIARAFQHTGPRQNLPMMLPEWARQVAASGEAPIEVQTCDASIDLSDVRDVVRAYRLLLEKGITGESYNIGSGIPRRTSDVLRLLLEAAGMSGRAVSERNPGRKFDPIADTCQLRGLTGWQPVDCLGNDDSRHLGVVARVAAKMPIASGLRRVPALERLRGPSLRSDLYAVSPQRLPPLRRDSGKRRSLHPSLPIVWTVLFRQTLRPGPETMERQGQQACRGGC